MDYLSGLVEKYRRRGALIDSNLLLLLFVGRFDVARIRTFKRTRNYIEDDYHVLERFVAYFDKIVTTPHVLTEVSNLSTWLPEGIREAYFRGFRKGVAVLAEVFEPATKICDCGAFEKIGLTDSAIALISRQRLLVLTDDLPLANRLQSVGIDAINHNHLRTIRWFG